MKSVGLLPGSRLFVTILVLSLVVLFSSFPAFAAPVPHLDSSSNPFTLPQWTSLCIRFGDTWIGKFLLEGIVLTRGLEMRIRVTGSALASAQ
jgi:hypothetical protein